MLAGLRLVWDLGHPSHNQGWPVAFIANMPCVAPLTDMWLPKTADIDTQHKDRRLTCKGSMFGARTVSAASGLAAPHPPLNTSSGRDVFRRAILAHRER